MILLLLNNFFIDILFFMVNTSLLTRLNAQFDTEHKVRELIYVYYV